MHWTQRQIRLDPRERGIHLVTREIREALPELEDYRVGIAHLFIQHTSASLTLNENASPSVRGDMERHLNEMVPEGASYYEHTVEGSDDMPAHIKASLMGSSLSIPIREGSFRFGTWQGIYLCEHRNRGGARRIIATLQGDRRSEGA